MLDTTIQTVAKIVASLALPVSQDTENAIKVLVGLCWNNQNNTDDEKGNHHRGITACCIVQIVRVNAGKGEAMPLNQIGNVAILLRDGWAERVEAARIAREARLACLRARIEDRSNKAIA